VRRRPAPAVWSPLEYCCHLRDVLITQRERVVRVLVEERPAVLPMHREERAVLTRYAEEEPSRVLVQLGVAAEMASWTFASLDASQWMRECLYNYPEPMTRSLEWVGRHSLHEAVHHLVDVRRILAPAAD
jgi:S-DNA-T family DNA segregation ATPase FtsK/SpoIIIE